MKVRGGIIFHRPAIMSVPDAPEHFTWNSWHMSGVERKMIAEGGTYYIPLRYSELPRYYREHLAPVHVAMFQVAPMDEHGFFNFGPNASHMAALCDVAEVIIVEVNRNMPRCLGGSQEAVHISQVTHIVEGENPPMPELGAGGPATEVEKAVAELIVPEIPNGACLQLGIGGMPNAVGSMIAQSDLKDLGVHTEMYVDAFVDIARAGKITGMKKNVGPGPSGLCLGAGTKKLYEYLNNNPSCMASPVDYTNDVRVISQLDNFISINNAVDVDLFGQVNAESSGTKHISGAGGQLDFVLGAYLSKGGKSFICCSSTYQDKEGMLHSRHRTDAQPWVHCDGYQGQHPPSGDGIWDGKLEGLLHLGEDRADHFRFSPGFPGGTDPGGGEDEDLAQKQPKVNRICYAGRKGAGIL